MRKTKIVATIGPSSSSEKMIEKLIKSGVNVFRFNFSHGNHEIHRENLKKVRDTAKRLKKVVAVLQDLSGPKIRIGQVEEPFYVHYGDILEIIKEPVLGNKRRISINYPQILDQLEKGDKLYIADGSIRLEVIEKTKTGIKAKVLVGGLISSRKGVNFPNVKLNIPSITEKDKEDIKFGVKEGFDIIALSFVKTADDVIEAKRLIKEAGGDQPIFAKIEKHEAVENIDDIIQVADGIMVARGDLGVEIEMEKVPVVQKMIIKKCNKAGKPVITATQMLTSMVSSPRPTRAEVSDVANAVLDGTDATMLSDETTVGKYPVEAVKVMAKTIVETEKIYPYYRDYGVKEKTSTAAIAKAATDLSKDIKAKAIVAFTKSGRTARNVSKYRPECKILAITHDEKTLRRLSIVWGVEPYMVIESNENTDIMLKEFIIHAYKKDFRPEDTLITLVGFVGGLTGSTSIIRIIRKEDLEQFLKI
jgi:pyruvate kinase